MTEEYKENILNYLVGNMPNESGVNEPQFKNDKILNNNINKDITVRLQDMGYETQTPHILGKIFDENSNFWLVYGYFSYLETAHSSKDNGYIYICDNSLNFISLIIEFESGTPLYPLMSINVDENNSYYALSNSLNNENISRVLLLNNVISSGAKSGEYYCKLRKSYTFPTNINTTFSFYRQNRIIKAPNESVYYITIYDRNYSQDVTTVLKFTINVGSENTWDIYRLPRRIDTVIFDVKIKKSDNLEFYIYGIDLYDYNYREYSIIGEEIASVKQISMVNQFTSFVTQVLVYDDNNIYILFGDLTNKTTYLRKIVGNTYTEIDNWSWKKVNEYYINPIISLENVNDILFLRKAITDVNYITNLSVAILKDTTLYNHNLGDTTGFSYQKTYEYIEFYITNSFNLFNIIVPKSTGDNTSYKTQLVYNDANYNGLPYDNKKSLVPHSGIIQNLAKDDIIFARNIYNKTVNNNTTNSTIQIPNTMLNGINIENKQLISEANNILNDNNDIIIKNIYETLFINYINKINIKNINNVDNEILNINGASRLNKSCTNEQDYDSAKATKIKYNYADGTTEVGTPTINYVNNTMYQYVITKNVTKLINSIDIISSDESTIYQTIDCTSLQVGKSYKLTQNVRIDGVKIKTQELLYNNENVLYNNENILIGG